MPFVTILKLFLSWEYIFVDVINLEQYNALLMNWIANINKVSLIIFTTLCKRFYNFLIETRIVILFQI